MFLIYIGKDFKKICKHPNLTEDFIDEYFWRLKPYGLERHQVLSPYIIFKYQNALNWQIMSETQELTEQMIEIKYKFVNWSDISQHQKLSYEFIKKWTKFLKWDLMLYNKNLSPDLLLKVQNLFK